MAGEHAQSALSQQDRADTDARARERESVEQRNNNIDDFEKSTRDVQRRQAV